MTDIRTAMLLAAGLGTRLRPITDTIPKPLVGINGRSMLDRALDKLVVHGVTKAVINLFYLGEKIRAHLTDRTDIEILFSEEPHLLDTGGGVKQALPQLGSEPFFCINTDLVWTDGTGMPTLVRLEKAWDPAVMDALMLMVPTPEAVGFGGSKGDFDLESQPVGRLTNPGWQKETSRPLRDYVWVAAQIMRPEMFAGVTETVFSNRLVWERSLERQRLYGLAHDGGGYHAGTPADLDQVNRLFAGLEGA